MLTYTTEVNWCFPLALSVPCMVFSEISKASVLSALWRLLNKADVINPFYILITLSVVALNFKRKKAQSKWKRFKGLFYFWDERISVEEPISCSNVLFVFKKDQIFFEWMIKKMAPTALSKQTWTLFNTIAISRIIMQWSLKMTFVYLVGIKCLIKIGIGAFHVVFLPPHTGSFVLNPALTSTGSNPKEGRKEGSSWTQQSMSPLLVNFIDVGHCRFNFSHLFYSCTPQWMKVRLWGISAVHWQLACVSTVRWHVHVK